VRSRLATEAPHLAHKGQKKAVTVAYVQYRRASFSVRIFFLAIRTNGCPMPQVNRRTVIAGASASAALGLAGCVGTTQNPSIQAGVPAAPAAQTAPLAAVQTTPLAPPQTAEADFAADVGGDPQYGAIYGPVTGEPFPVPPIRLSEINRAFLRKKVAYATNEPPGTIVVDPAHHYLYHVEEGGQATRYGVGVGRKASSGPAKRRSRASRNGRIGIRQRNDRA